MINVNLLIFNSFWSHIELSLPQNGHLYSFDLWVFIAWEQVSVFPFYG